MKDALPRDVVVWDTPDCDSVESRKYLHSVVEAITAADLVVYITSGERFAVSHLLEWIFVMHDAGLELVKCLNRTRKADHPVIIRNQQEKHFPMMANSGWLHPICRSSR